MSFPHPSFSRVAPSAPNGDFVSRDLASLASHMERCARSRDRLFAFKRRVQMGQSALSGRIVTVAFVAITVVATAFMFV